MDGGMATVFKCIDSILERPVAVKVIPRNADQKRLMDELAALFKIRSKHVVQVYDICFDASSVGIVQEFVDGKELSSTDVAPTECQSYLKMLWQIASGISDIHEAGLIHRDIKPSNMKIDGSEGILKIFDFGLAREDGPDAETMGYVGTPGFSAPELFGRFVTFTQEVDTFAFGASALRYAIQSKSPELEESPPRAFSVNPFDSLPFEIPSEISELLFRCLSHEISNRPQMRIVCDAIKKHLLFNRHRALLVLKGKASYLDCNKTSVKLNFGAVARVVINYDGLSFSVSEVEGDVFVNNAKIGVGYVLPGACVLTFGAPELGSGRAYVTFDLSNPEITV